MKEEGKANEGREREKNKGRRKIIRQLIKKVFMQLFC